MNDLFENDFIMDDDEEDLPTVCGEDEPASNWFVLPPELEGKDFGIRRLTPRELFRLMGVDDESIDKIQATGISVTSQGRLAGNSIVVDVLYHLFRKMFIETDADVEAGDQLSLF